MGATKNMLIQMQAEDFASLYEPTFTKKEAQSQGVELVKKVVDSGNIDKLTFMANLCRLKEVVNSADAEMRKHLPDEKSYAWGVEFTPVTGGETLNLAEDPIYVQLKKELDNRVELLKLAQKQDVIDAYGNDVPKVGTTPRKSSVTIKF